MARSKAAEKIYRAARSEGMSHHEAHRLARWETEGFAKGKKATRSRLEMGRRVVKKAKSSKKGNPSLIIKPGKWIKAEAVRVRKVAGRVVMDIKKAI